MTMSKSGLKRRSTMTTDVVLWRRLDQPGHDSARLLDADDGRVLEGAALFREPGSPCRLDYRIVCDRHWRTVSARVTGWAGSTDVDVAVDVDAGRRWTLNGRPCPGVEGCDDIDLSFSPATNLLPIRRARLRIGARVSVRAAWLRFPDLRLEPLEQSYERIGERQYRYRAGTFTAVLDTNADGFVTRYPGSWEADELGG